jgi:membrane-associated protease RseP (regulator of RpoE activity)
VNPYLGYEIALAVVVGYAAVVIALVRSGRVGPDRTFSLLGPALMIKTRRGRAALDRWGRFRRAWSRIGDLGIVLAILAMAAMVALLLIGAVVSFRLTPATAPSPQEALGLPGINPIIPVGYGIVALAIGIVLHELFHGIIARSQKIGVKSLGILWCVVPIGAFVEQDDTEMLAAPRRHRDRVAAAGVLANFLLTVLFFFALSGLLAVSVQPNAPGVAVAGVDSGLPAALAAITPGDIITSVNGTATPTVSAFENALALTYPNETIPLVYYSHTNGSLVTADVTLAPSPSVAGRGYLGVEILTLTPADLKQTLIFPPSSSAGPVVGALDWITLPFAGLEPMTPPATAYFHLAGPLAGEGSGPFWIEANLLYWLAWMNLLLGLSNALPLVPLDGGLLIRDFAASVAARLRRGWSAARLDEFGGRAAVASSLAILVLLLWQFVVPRLL